MDVGRIVGTTFVVVTLAMSAAACSGSSPVAGQESPADGNPSVTPNSTATPGPCNGNPCIGDWQKEAAEGDSVVQCADGAWSHAGGLRGACSDHGGESTTQGTVGSESSSSSDLPAATAGPCDGNPCIGDWQKEAADGGTVVECSDGTWSHAGGLRGACSHHGGESAGPAASDAANQTASASGPGAGLQGFPVQCGYGVAGSAGVTCTFANSAFYEYWKASGDDPSQSRSISVWSAEGQQSYELFCTPGDGVVDCTGENSSGVTLDAAFVQSAITAYTDQQAAAYAASGKLGPNGSNSPPSTFTPGDQNPHDASAASCAQDMAIGPQSDCYVAQEVAGDLARGVWAPPGSDAVTEGSTTITFECVVIGQDNSQAAQPGIYRCASVGDPQDWFEFEFT
jgi:hypothetical protein